MGNMEEPPHPFKGFKRAFPVVCFDTDNTIATAGFYAHTSQVFYQTISSAYCPVPDAPDHAEFGCRCGFYALSEKKDILKWDFAGAVPLTPLVDSPSSSAVLHVTLFGDVVESAQGFKATDQQVDQVFYADTCFTCAAPAVCLTKDSLVGVFAGFDAYAFVPCCNLHAAQNDSISLSQFSKLLNTVVRFSDLGDQNMFAANAQIRLDERLESLQASLHELRKDIIRSIHIADVTLVATIVLLVSVIIFSIIAGF